VYGQPEKEKMEALREEQRASGRLLSWGFLANAVCLVAAYAVVIYLVLLVLGEPEIAQFDPYQILGKIMDPGGLVLHIVLYQTTIM
jgi:hypothetical protein